MTKVKICGITNVSDAQSSIDAGTDYIGLIFAPSKRTIIKESAADVIAQCSSFTSFVGVFLNGKKKSIETLCQELGIRTIQFHGNETPAFCNYFVNRGYEVIKVFRVKDRSSLDGIEEYTKITHFLFDTYSPHCDGGTGTCFDWSIIANHPFVKDKRIILSGGLHSENVAAAIQACHPFAVDASSLLETSPGIKDHEKVKRFIAAAKHA